MTSKSESLSVSSSAPIGGVSRAGTACGGAGSALPLAGRPSCILPPAALKVVEDWLSDDTPSFDVGGLVVGDTVETANLLGKSRGILAGVPFADAVFKAMGLEVEWLLPEGAEVKPVTVVARVIGPVRKILLAERTALNIVTRASGIATAARELADLKAAAKWHGEVAGTRKTTPGFRMVEKYALVVGGVSTHRMDLSHMIMLKDNHIWSAGSITGAVRLAREAAGFSSKIEVECRNLAEAREACAAGADICMLDNYKPAELHRDAAAIKAEYPAVLIEGSGGITKDTIRGYFGPHVDVLSLGSLTQGYKALDFSLKVQKGDGVKQARGDAPVSKL